MTPRSPALSGGREGAPETNRPTSLRVPEARGRRRRPGALSAGLVGGAGARDRRPAAVAARLAVGLARPLIEIDHRQRLRQRVAQRRDRGDARWPRRAQDHRRRGERRRAAAPSATVAWVAGRARPAAAAAPTSEAVARRRRAAPASARAGAAGLRAVTRPVAGAGVWNSSLTNARRSAALTRLPASYRYSASSSRNSAPLWWRSARILLQRVAHDAIQRRRQIAAELVEPIGARVAHHQQHVEIRRRRVEPPAHQHLGQHDADREQIAAPVEHAAGHLLGRHVAVLALERAGLGLRLALLRVRDAEVAQLHVAALGNEDVRRRDVAVDDLHRAPFHVARVVRVVQRLEHLHDDEHRDVAAARSRASARTCAAAPARRSRR